VRVASPPLVDDVAGGAERNADFARAAHGNVSLRRASARARQHRPRELLLEDLLALRVRVARDIWSQP